MVDNTDWTFMAGGYEDGSLPVADAHEPGTSGPEARTQVALLSRFFHGLPFLEMRPDTSWINEVPPLEGAVSALLAPAKTLLQSGRPFAAAFLAAGGLSSVGLELDERAIACRAVRPLSFEEAKLYMAPARGDVVHVG